MIFASNQSEVIQLLDHIELKEHANREDIRQLAYLGMPIHCCIKEHQMNSISFSVLIKEFEKFANQAKFEYLRNKFYEKLQRREAKEALISSILNLPVIKFILKYVK